MHRTVGNTLVSECSVQDSEVRRPTGLSAATEGFGTKFGVPCTELHRPRVGLQTHPTLRNQAIGVQGDSAAPFSQLMGHKQAVP